MDDNQTQAADDPLVAEHFENLDKQQYAAHLGMWVFIGSEALLFGGLFALYTALRMLHSESFAVASQHSDALVGTVNTLILITSSFTVAWAVHAIRHDRHRMCALSLGATLLLGAMFLLLKGYEYSHHFEQGIYPGIFYRFDELPDQGAIMYFTLYYVMTGLHGLHVIAGMSVIAWLCVLTLRRRFTARRHVAVENGALYWHLVDLVWIFLWPLLYLVA